MAHVLRRPWLFALFIGLVAAGVAGLVSAHNGDPTQIHGCVNQAATPRGQVIIYSAPGLTGAEPATSTCGTRGSPVDWGSQGAVGPTGASGPRGTGNAVEVGSDPFFPLTLTRAPVGTAATITPGPGGHVFVSAWLAGFNVGAVPCQILANLQVDGVPIPGGPALAQVPPLVPGGSGSGDSTIPLTTALTLSPNTVHTVQIIAEGFVAGDTSTPCGVAGRTRIVLVDLG
jgi:hypothetical protein